jgi:hypothetical protein
MNNFNFHNIDFTSPVVLIGIVAVVLLVAGAIAVAVNQRKKKSDELRQQFGPEYDLAVKEHGARSKAEARLLDRVRRVESFKIRELTPAERDGFVAQWSAVQSRFVDHPRGALTEADELVNEAMIARGFPAAGFDQRVEDISVHHSLLVDSYRSANATALRASRNEANTEELRTAMIQYRTLFDELLGTGAVGEAEVIPPAQIELRKSA